MKNISTLFVLLLGMLLSGRLHAQYLLLDDMEGNGPCSGRWTYYAGNTTTGKVEFGVPNPSISSVNPSPPAAGAVLRYFGSGRSHRPQTAY